jgi:putative peptidoglycan lipid II flippase
MKFLFSNLSKRQSVASGAITIAVFSIVSKLLGLVRHTLIASQFGTDAIAESFFAAFRIPDFLFNALVLGALSTAFVPVFLELFTNKKVSDATIPEDISTDSGEESLVSVNIDYANQITAISTAKRWKLLKKLTQFTASSKDTPHFDLTNAFLNLLLIVLTLSAGILWIITPALTEKLVPGFDSGRLSLTISFTRIMLISPILFGVSNVLSSSLQAFKRFTAFALAPVLYNAGIIFGIAVLYPLIGPAGLAYGVVIGALLHLHVQ